MNVLLDSTLQKRPTGLVMDKMTPNKHTSQIHAVIIPVPLMLEVPPVQNDSTEGLAMTSKKVFNSAGLSDDQLEGLGWDGEYIKKGVKDR